MSEFVCMKQTTMELLSKASKKDKQLKNLRQFICEGWPENKNAVPESVRSFYGMRDQLTIEGDLVFRGEQIIVPHESRPEMIDKLHQSHVGTEATIRRARESLYWPGMRNDIKQKIEQCGICNSYQIKQQKEPLMPTDVQDRPWQRVGLDIFTLDGNNYLVSADYYSNYFEIDRLSTNSSSESVIKIIKIHFARYGIPDVVVTDNGT